MIRDLHGAIDTDGAVRVHDGLVVAADQEAGVGAGAVALEPQIGLDDLPVLGFDHEVTEVADVLRGQVSELRAGHDAHAEGAQLLADLVAQRVGVAGGAQDLIGGLDDRDVQAGESIGELAGQLDADGATADDHHRAGAAEVLVQLLEASLRHGRAVRGVLRGERIGRSGREDDVVGLDRVVAEDVNGRAVNTRHGAAHDLTAVQQVRVGHEDRVFPHGVDRGTQRGCVMDELVLLFDEDNVRDGVQPLCDRDASVTSADDCDACHVFPPYEWTASIVSPGGHECAC